jgi:predicted DNA-binding transcriptional regulator AlpA
MTTIMSETKTAAGRLIPLKEFAAGIRQSVRQVYRLVDRGELPKPLKQGNRNFFSDGDLSRYLQRLEAQRS